MTFPTAALGQLMDMFVWKISHIFTVLIHVGSTISGETSVKHILKYTVIKFVLTTCAF